VAVQLTILGSGSAGNCAYVETGETRVLVDAGFSARQIRKRLASIGRVPENLTGILITHEHSDHAGGLKMLVKDLPVQAFMTPGTLRALKADEYELNGSQLVPVPAGVPFTVGDIEVTPFSVPHDAAEPVAFTMNCGGAKITQLTDIGYMPDHVAKQLRESDVLILESNHDLEMLRVGPYPWTLKQRLMGRYGHLSNAAVGRYIREQFDGQAQQVVLAHLSSKNNHPAIAKHEAARALRDRGLANTQLMVTSQDEPTAPIRL